VVVERLKLTGLLEPDANVGDISSTLGGEATLGYYDGATQKLALVTGPASKDPKAAVAVLAHELTHALQDQKFQVFDQTKKLALGEDTDASAAYTALFEGDAKLIEEAYAKRYGATANSSGGKAAQQAAKELPFALVLEESVTYDAGAEFVAALVKESGYEAVDKALESDPPTTTAEILDPKRYLSGDEPTDVKLSVKPVLGRGWSLVEPATFGELDLIELLAFEEKQVEAAGDVINGWGGGRIELWRQGDFDPQSCPAPCVAKDALVGGVHWLSAKDASGFETAFGDSLEENQNAKPVGDGVWTVGDGAVGIGTAGTETTIAYAPTPSLAKQLVAP